MQWGVELKMRDYIAFVLASVLVLVRERLQDFRARPAYAKRRIRVRFQLFLITFLSLSYRDS